MSIPEGEIGNPPYLPSKIFNNSWSELNFTTFFNLLSATKIFPVESTTKSMGLWKRESSTPFFPNSETYSPSKVNFWILLFPVSATNKISLSINRPRGELNSPLDFPVTPHCKTKFPSKSNFWILFSLLSDTKTKFSETAIPCGELNSPASEPFIPHVLMKFPELSKTWILELPRSVTYTLPSIPSAMRCGKRKFPASILPDSPQLSSNSLVIP